MSAPSTWTDDRVQTLIILWRDGASASRIARSLGGVTRNAVIGKVHRLGLSGRAKPSAPGAQRSEPLRKPRLRAMPPLVRVCPAAAETRSVAGLPETGLASVVSVRRRQCRWPMGDPRDDGFCLCGRSAERGAYCAPHGALAYQPTDPKHLLRFARLR